MPQILLPQRFLAQPQYPARLDPSHWLAKDTTFAITGAAPDFNAATARAASISAGGSGFSRRVTQQGVSLYTPNGGWADFGVNQDWAGPNTIIALCRVNGIDNPWGGLFSKDSSGTSTQFGIGRNNLSDSLYGSVDDSTAVSFGGSSIPSLADFSVIAFTHSGVTSASMSYYLDGILAGTTSALAAQPSGSGVLGLGRSRDANVSFDSDADWLAFIRINRVLSAAEMAQQYRTFWSLWKAPDRRIFLASAATSYTLTADPLSLDFTATDANLEYNRVLPADSVALSFDVADATLKRAYALSADSASIAFSGTDASLKYARILQAGSVTTDIAFADASIEYNRSLQADPATIQFGVADATLTYSQPGNYVLTAEPVALGFAATDATLKYDRRLTAGSAELAFNGADASLRYARAVIAEAVQIAFNLNDATLSRTGGPEPVTSIVERTATFRRSKSVTVRFN